MVVVLRVRAQYVVSHKDMGIAQVFRGLHEIPHRRRVGLYFRLREDYADVHELVL